MVEKKKYEIYKKLNLGLNLGQRLVYAVALDGNSIDISQMCVDQDGDLGDTSHWIYGVW